MKRRTLRRLGAAAAAAAGALAALFALSWALCPPPLDAAGRYPAGLSLFDREGNGLRVKLGPDDTDCRPFHEASRDSWIVKALVAAEDKRFFRHRGADFFALARAVAQNFGSMRRVSGASTLTQQTVRLVEPHPRTLRWKWVELFQALRLERARSKEWILSQYLNRAPFGSNLVGIEAAARGWFAKSPDDLSLGEAALLAGIVQAPTRFRPDRHLDRALKRRDYVLDRMLELGFADPGQVAAARASVPALRRAPRPFAWPHYCDWAEAVLVPTGAVRCTLPLDPAVQALAQRAVDARAAALGARAAAVVADPATLEVRALACSGDYFSPDAGQVNTATAPRPAGSVLTPLLYARAIDRGLLAPTQWLPDVPRRYGGRRPANFDPGYRGVVRADEALVLSLNLPFFELARLVGVPDALAAFRAAGLRTVPDDPDAVGLGLAAGNVPVRLVDLALAYARLARAADGPGGPQVRTGGPAPDDAPFCLSPEACWLVSDILSGPERTLAALGHQADARLPRAAWKTGTSSAHRDAWTVLWTPREVVAVWCGHASGRFGDESLSGLGAAAPLAWEIFRGLHPDGAAAWFGAPPAGLVRRDVCARTGLPPSPDCPETRPAWALAGRTSPVPCGVHRRGPDGRVLENWPADVAAWMREKRGELSIASPRDGARVRLPAGSPGVAVVPAGAEPGATLWWFVDGAPAGSRPASETFLAADLAPGAHAVSCSTAAGATASVRFELLPSGD
ncbi:MAG: transglycosylase domain-containing protein [Kiritimatiellae bacterium]|nr:transglycosylase domain-containing protein [Kiritimatiellia bacterium]